MINWSNFSDFFSTGIPSEVFYPSLLLTVLLIIVGGTLIKNDKKKYVFGVLLIEYLFIVVNSTIICRKSMVLNFDRLELIPFWTYKSVIEHTPGVSVWDIILNVVLFVPLGFLLKMLKPSMSFLVMLLIAFMLSLFIESNQYIYEKGVAQFDDVMHNIIGTILGYKTSNILSDIKKSNKI